ncbi:unnamed protein product [Cochlearia groenlandica]
MMMRSKEMKKQSNLAKMVKSPVRFLIMARDAYVRSLTSCSVGLIRGGGGSGGFGLSACSFQICEASSTTLPRCFTLNLSTTTTTRGGSGEGEVKGAMGRPLDLRRNYSCMVLGRIDEEIACDEFGELNLLFNQLNK